jgi:hypothetical protein
MSNTQLLLRAAATMSWVILSTSVPQRRRVMTLCIRSSKLLTRVCMSSCRINSILVAYYITRRIPERYKVKSKKASQVDARVRRVLDTALWRFAVRQLGAATLNCKIASKYDSDNTKRLLCTLSRPAASINVTLGYIHQGPQYQRMLMFTGHVTDARRNTYNYPYQCCDHRTMWSMMTFSHHCQIFVSVLNSKIAIVVKNFLFHR